MKNLSSTVKSLQAVSDLLFIDTHLRKNANAQIVYACVMLGQGILTYPEAGSIISMLGAVVLGVEAMWLLHVRKPLPILAAAILLWASAIWNLYFYFAATVDNRSTTWLVVALAYAYFGFREYRMYRKFRAALLAQTPESSAEIQQIVAGLSVAHTGRLEPHVNGDRWQVLLFENGIVMRDVTKGAMLIESREATHVESQGTTVVGGLIKMKIKVPSQTLSCTFKDDEAAAVLAWSGGAVSHSEARAAVTS